MTRPAWLDSMASRVFLILLIGIMAAATLAFTVADLQRRDGERRARDQRLADRVADLAQLLGRAPPSLRPTLLGPGPEAPRLVATTDPYGDADVGLRNRLAARLGAAAGVEAWIVPPDACRPGPRAQEGPPPPAPPPEPPPPAEPPPTRPPPSGCRRVSLILADGERVSIVAPGGPRPPPPTRGPLTPAFLGVLGLAAAILAYAVARFATAPLRRLSTAASALGRDLERPPLAVEGPLEVRRAAQAFNAMQVRLKRHLSERTHMLAAITHDLQTPMTRMRLRLEKVGDAELRDQLLADQAAMLDMIREGLDLAKASAETEPMRELDIDSLLHSLCEDAVEAGAQVTVTARCGCSCRTRPEAIKRCVANLLDNAIKYAGPAELAAVRDAGFVKLSVSDSGPGIPADQREAVLEPFVRLEASRSRDTGGVGLGLSIARLMADRAGASLALSAGARGGVVATVSLPCSD